MKSILKDLHKKANNFVKNPRRTITSFAYDLGYSALSDKGLINEKYKGVYHYHIRKSGGTSLNFSFLSLYEDNPQKVYRNIIKSSDKRQMLNRKVYLGWDINKIQSGNFFYGWSHQPMHQVQVPKSHFTVTILRNPLKRVLSHYKMVYRHVNQGIKHPIAKREGKYLGKGLGDYLDNIPKSILLTQLFMFSKNFSVDDAFNNITSLSYFFFTENYEDGLKGLSNKLEIKLKPMHIRKSDLKIKVTQKERKKMNKLLRPEILLYNKLQKYYKSEIFSKN